MAAWDKDLDDAPAWEKDLDPPAKQKKRANPESDVPKQGVMGNIISGGLRGAGSIGATILTPYDLAVGNTKSIGNPERREAMDNALVSLGADPNSFAFGAGKFGAELAGTAAIPVAKTGGLVARSAKNALSAGAAAGMVNPEDAGTGALIGGVATPVIAGVSGIARKAKEFANPLMDLVRPSGPENVLRRYITGAVGEANVPATVNAARASVAPKQGPGIFEVPGYRPTTAEAMVGVPEGSPIARLQDLTAQTRGGPSAKFGKIAADREVLIDAAEKTRDAIADPARKIALGVAKINGVETKSIVSQIDSLANTEGYRASDVVTKSLADVRSKIERHTVNGKINPNDLYTIRKEVGSTIEKFSKETANWDKSLTAKLERSLQQGIDDSIEKAGGVGWKDYLREYAGRSKAIESVKDRAKVMYSPPQRTNLGGGLDIANETRTPMPNLLSRAAMASNFALRRLGARMEPKIDEIAAEAFADPQKYADLMSKIPANKRFQVDKALRAANALAVYQAD